MTGFEFFLHVIWSIVWPIKGIIYMEEQAIQWILAYGSVLFSLYAPSIITVIAIYWVIMFVVFERNPRIGHHGGRLIGRAIRFTCSMIIALMFAWFFLIYGALIGERCGNRGERNAQVVYRYDNHVTRGFGIIYRFTQLSLNFRLGRAVYRFLYWLLGFIPVITTNNHAREVLARLLSMIVILWGVWHIPYDITH